MPDPSRTPAYVGYGTFRNQIQGLEHVPSTIDYSVFEKMSGSTRNAFFSALRFFDLINEEGAPSKVFIQLASSDDGSWNSTMTKLIRDYYTPEQIDALATGTIASLKKSFEEHVGQSMVGSVCRFLIAAAKDVNLPVSATVAKGKVGSVRRSKPRSQSKQGSSNSTTEERKHNPSRKRDPSDQNETISFPIYFQDKAEGRIEIPRNLAVEDLPMFNAMVTAVTAFVESKKGGK